MKIIVDTKSETPSYTCMYNLNIATGTCIISESGGVSYSYLQILSMVV